MSSSGCIILDAAPEVAIVAEEAGLEMTADALTVAFVEFAFDVIKALFGPEFELKPIGLKSVPTTELWFAVEVELTDGNNGLFGKPEAIPRALPTIVCGEISEGGGGIVAPNAAIWE